MPFEHYSSIKLRRFASSYTSAASGYSSSFSSGSSSAGSQFSPSSSSALTPTSSGVTPTASSSSSAVTPTTCPTTCGGSPSTPSPTIAGKYITSTITLGNITTSQWTELAQSVFKDSIAFGMSGIAASQVYILTSTRRDLRVAFYVQTGLTDATAASNLADALNTYLNDATDNGFVAVLNRKALEAGLTNFVVSGVIVNKAPSVTNTDPSTN